MKNEVEKNQEKYPFYVTLQLNARFRPLDRGELEDALQSVLERLEIGSVDGGGTMLQPSGEVKFCDIEICLMNHSDDTWEKLEKIINHFGVPKGSKLHAGEKSRLVGEQEGLAVYLNGTELPDEVYASCDVNYVIEQMNLLMGKEGAMYSYWQGPAETALYFYGTSFEKMQQAIVGFTEEYPLCRNCRIVQIA